jgi:hypothetical protein
MGKQSLEDYIYRNSYETGVLVVLLILSYLAYRRRKESVWIFFVVAAAARLVPTIGNLWTYPTAIFWGLWAMYHGAPLIAVAGLVLSLRRKEPDQPTAAMAFR